MSQQDDQNFEIDALVQKGDAADQVESLKGLHSEAVKNAIGELQSCCASCTLISPLPPCANTCIQLPSGV